MTEPKTLAKELSSRNFLNSFPNLEEEAVYNQLFQIIQLNFITAAEFQDIQANGLTEDNFLTDATIRHELTHYWDHIGTLWGQRNLVLVFNALNAYVNQDIEEYWRIKALHLQCKKDTFGPYFTQVFDDHQSTFKEPWVTKISSGVRFDINGKVSADLPLLFIRCDKQDGTELARTPISVSALLETNAIYEEYKLKASFVESIADDAVKKEETKILNEEIEDFFYATDLALYSVVAHLAAKEHHLSDVLEIYKLASSLSTLSLNLPEDLIRSMRIKVMFDETWDTRFRALADNGDKGFAYYRLNENLAERFAAEPYLLSNVLEASGLPDKETMELKVLEEMTFNIREISAGPFNEMGQLLLNYGITLHLKRGLDGKKDGFEDWVKTEIPWPYFLFKDTYFNPDDIDLQEAFHRMLDKPWEADLSDHFKVMAFYHDKMSAFNEACGV